MGEQASDALSQGAGEGAASDASGGGQEPEVTFVYEPDDGDSDEGGDSDGGSDGDDDGGDDAGGDGGDAGGSDDAGDDSGSADAGADGGDAPGGQDQRDQGGQQQDQLQQEFDQQLQEDRPDFIDVDMDKLKSHVTNLNNQAKDLREQGDTFGALKLEREAGRLLDQLEDNERKREAWQKRQHQRQLSEQEAKALGERVTKASEFYRNRNNIPAETWKLMSDFVADALNPQSKTFDPVFQSEFAGYARVSEVGAVRLAHEYAVKHMGKGAEQDRQRREDGKGKVPGGKGGGSGEIVKVRDYDSLMALPSKQIVAFKKQHPKIYKKIMDKRFSKK